MLIRALDPTDLDAALDVRARSFGHVSEAEQTSWRHLMEPALAAGLVLAAYDGSRLAALARIRRFTQWWCGRDMPMAGIAGVVVAPEDRGRGIGRALMTAVLRRVDELGFPLSALYPATTPLYRSLGWEHAGARHTLTIPAEALRTLGAEPVTLRRAGVDDVAQVLDTIAATLAAHRSNGPILRDAAATRQWLAEPEVFSYLAADGFLAYGWDGADTLRVECLLARSVATSRAFWALVGSGSSIATSVRAHLAPDDPVRWLTREAVVRETTEQPWMLRLVDAPAAVAARGYPASATVDAVLAVSDEQLPGNAGAWRLTVAGGRGVLVRAAGGAPAVRLGAGGLAALFAGTGTATLGSAGLAEICDEAAAAQLDTAFGGRAFMLDYF